ncbi:MAG: TIGR01244 family phosphatase [Halomonadaceae bacterium]|nr:MAG: TIGR01244 family phosphatase [Halomonadaceae bacterium]
MKVHRLEPGFAVTDALTSSDLEEAMKQGFRTVICNRRPGEAEDYPGGEAFARKAEILGLKWVCIPVSLGEYSQQDVDEFSRTLQESPAPILAFCRTGRRAVHLWAQARAQEPQCNFSGLLQAVREAGHDPQSVADILKIPGEHTAI